MLRIQTIAVVLVFIVCASVASAQAPASTGRGDAIVTNLLDITLINPPCDEVSKVWVIMDGDENRPIPADPAGVCHWTATRRIGKFDVNLSDFSLRLGIARTPCHHPSGDRANGKGFGKLVFQCCRTDARRVKISTNQELPISYVREVPKDAKDPQSVRCNETYVYLKQPVDILSVWYPAQALAPRAAVAPDSPSVPYIERLRIQFGEPDPKKKAPLLIFNHSSITKHLKGNSLTSENLLTATREQRSKGLAAAQMSFSGEADDAERARLKRIGLTRVTVTMVK